MSRKVPKVFIKVETPQEQEETLQKSRKTFKTLQKSTVGKENLTGRTPLILDKEKVEKVALDATTPAIDESHKRQKKETATTSVQTTPEAKVKPEDLTTEGKPSEGYFEALAERRRVALEDALLENEMLHVQVKEMAAELRKAKGQLAEAKTLCSLLNEALNEADTDEEDAEPTPIVDQVKEIVANLRSSDSGESDDSD